MTEQQIIVRNTPIRILTSGQGEKAIVFIHGNSSSADIWRWQLEDKELQKRARLIAIDLPGHGKSGRQASYHMPDLGSVLLETIEKLQLKEYILVGLSYGSSLIGELAPKFTGCKGFVLVSPNVVNNTYNPGVIIRPFPGMEALTSETAEDGVLHNLASKLVNKTPELVEEYKGTYRQADPAFRTTLLQDIMNGAWADQLANMQNTGVPVFVVFGKEEQVVKADYMDEFPAKWKNQVFHLEGAGHFANAEAPEEFNRLLEEYADEVLG